jgi:hypothetical protein
MNPLAVPTKTVNHFDVHLFNKESIYRRNAPFSYINAGKIANNDAINVVGGIYGRVVSSQLELATNNDNSSPIEIIRSILSYSL